MRAIETGYNPTEQHSSWNETDRFMPSPFGAAGSTHIDSPETAADSARRTLLRYSAAEYSNRVTRTAYKQTHGRRMSTLRNMQKKISTSLTPTAAATSSPTVASTSNPPSGKKLPPGAGRKEKPTASTMFD